MVPNLSEVHSHDRHHCQCSLIAQAFAHHQDQLSLEPCEYQKQKQGAMVSSNTKYILPNLISGKTSAYIFYNQGAKQSSMAIRGNSAYNYIYIGNLSENRSGGHLLLWSEKWQNIVMEIEKKKSDWWTIKIPKRATQLLEISKLSRELIHPNRRGYNFFMKLIR